MILIKKNDATLWVMKIWGPGNGVIGQKKQESSISDLQISVVKLDKEALATVSNDVYEKGEVSEIAQGMFTPKSVLH